MDVKKRRLMAGRLSQMKLARLSGVSRFRISLAESGHIVLNAEEQAAIERALAREVQILVDRFKKVPAQKR